MSITVQLVVLIAAAAGACVLAFLALSRADRRSADDRDPTAAVARFRRAVVTYLDVGAWSGRTYPLGAVVAGYDGKEHGRAALVWAAQEAARRDAPLVVLHAANYPGMTGPPGTGLHHRDPGALEAADELTARGVAEAVAAVPGLDVLGATEVASAGRALVEASRKASLVVLGSRGHRRLVGTWRRSVGLEVTSRAYSPVVVVRGESAAVHVTRADLLGPPLDCRRGARG